MHQKMIYQNMLQSLLAASLLFQFSMSGTSAQEAPSLATPAPFQTVLLISPSNSSINFVGKHVGDDPKPRLGGFAAFQGVMQVDPDNKKINTIDVGIEVGSVWTEFAKLTEHLKNVDFFEVEKFPHSRFVSTSIKMGGTGECLVTGVLSLHGQTKSISFPAKYEFKNGGLLFTARFVLDRSKFGMDQMLSGVEAAVDLEILVGQPTVTLEAQPGHGGDRKKKQANNTKGPQRQLVAINLPNMT
ncbi:MAG: YceI family protein [Mariniblastus sp.]|nr:YceI family protein [Mariniblastus sp.]